MLFDYWRARRAWKRRIDEIHGEIVAAARAVELYAAFGVPDDIDGRFEMMALHAGLALRRLGELGSAGSGIAQDLVDRVFAGFDDALREMSMSDVKVARRMKSMAEAFYGRSAVYYAALAVGNRDALASALARNVYRGEADAGALGPRLLAGRVMALAAAFETMPIEAFLEGRFHYPLGQGALE